MAREDHRRTRAICPSCTGATSIQAGEDDEPAGEEDRPPGHRLVMLSTQVTGRG
jgi:hypothetical protein